MNKKKKKRIEKELLKYHAICILGVCFSWITNISYTFESILYIILWETMKLVIV